MDCRAASFTYQPNKSVCGQWQAGEKGAVIDGNYGKWLTNQLATIQLWQSFGIVPRIIHGQGLGALAAACAAGIVSPEVVLDRLRGAGVGRTGAWPDGRVLGR